MTTVGATGHQAIPKEAVGFIESGIRMVLQDVEGPIGICSLAAGADQLFAQEVLRASGKLHVIVPANDYETAFQNPAALEKYRSLVKQAATVDVLEFGESSERAFLKAGERVVDLCDILIAVWDGQPARGEGGTADIVEYARQQGKPVTIIWPEGVRR